MSFVLHFWCETIAKGKQAFVSVISNRKIEKPITYYLIALLPGGIGVGTSHQASPRENNEVRITVK